MSDPGHDESDPASEPEALEAAYPPEYLRECASGDARTERLDELKRRIAAGAYCIDAEWVAQELISRGDLDSD
jgi:anti-sigma28 factor (negative regulator of flagellin synthesis)